jgi:hypothetical protein
VGDLSISLPSYPLDADSNIPTSYDNKKYLQKLTKVKSPSVENLWFKVTPPLSSFQNEGKSSPVSQSMICKSYKNYESPPRVLSESINQKVGRSGCG